MEATNVTSNHVDKNRAQGANKAFVKVKEAKKALTSPIVVLNEGTHHQNFENNNTFEFKFNGSDEETDEQLYSQAYRSSSKSRKWWANKVIYSHWIQSRINFLSFWVLIKNHFQSFVGWILLIGFSPCDSVAPDIGSMFRSQINACIAFYLQFDTR